jgi:hypothetical protein
MTLFFVRRFTGCWPGHWQWRLQNKTDQTECIPEFSCPCSVEAPGVSSSVKSPGLVTPSPVQGIAALNACQQNYPIDCEILVWSSACPLMISGVLRR